MSQISKCPKVSVISSYREAWERFQSWDIRVNFIPVPNDHTVVENINIVNLTIDMYVAFNKKRTFRIRSLNFSTGISPVCSTSRASNPLLSPSSLGIWIFEFWKVDGPKNISDIEIIKYKNGFLKKTSLNVTPLLVSGFAEFFAHMWQEFLVTDQAVAIPVRDDCIPNNEMVIIQLFNNTKKWSLQEMIVYDAVSDLVVKPFPKR